MKSKDFEIRAPFLGVGDLSGVSKVKAGHGFIFQGYFAGYP